MKERAALQKLHEVFDGRGLVLLAISMDRQGRSIVEPYKKRNRLTFPHLLDADHEVTRTYGVRYTPTSFIVDQRGHIVARVIGLRPWADPEFQRLFEEMIAEE
ncbi:MAG: peroxiredoxin family protein [Nitrospinota bacterium]